MKKSFLIFTLCIYNALIGQQESTLARALADITINNKRIFPNGFADLPFEQQDRILNFEIGQFLAKLQGYYPYLTIPFVGQHTFENTEIPENIMWRSDTLLAYSSGTIQTFNTTSGQKILNLGTFSPYHIALNHDGSRFAGSGDQVLIIDASTGQVIYGVETFEHVYSLAWSHDNSKLATATIDNVEIWDGRGNRLITLLPPEQTDRMDIAWTPDDSRIVALAFTPTPIYTNGIFIYAWDINTRARVRVQQLAVSRSGRIREISWSPDCSKIAVTYGDNDYKPVHGVDVFDGTSGERIAEMNVKAIDVTWSPDSSQLAIVSSDKIDIYDIMPGHQGSLVAVLETHPPIQLTGGHKVQTAVWGPDDRIATFVAGIGEPAKIQIWKPIKKQLKDYFYTEIKRSNLKLEQKMLFAILINVKRMYPSIPITMKWLADHQPKNQRLNKELYDIFNRFPKAISEALTDIFVHRLN